MKKIFASFVAVCSVLLMTGVSNAQVTKAPVNPDYTEYWSSSKEERENRIVPSPIMRSGASVKTKSRAILSSASLPQTYDLRKDAANGGVTGVENQGSRNVCWTFSGLGVLESHLLINSGTTYDFSELHMDYANAATCPGGQKYSEGTTNSTAFNRSADTGGNIFMSSTYMLSDKGVVNESEMPYNASSGVVALSKVTGAKSADIWLKDYAYLPTELVGQGKMTAEEYRQIVKQYLMKYGALDVCLNATTTTSGNIKAFYNSANVYGHSNHAVILVGWDDTYSKDNFTPENGSPSKPSNDGAWIIQNTWGLGSGYDGYFYLSYEDKSFYTIAGAVLDADKGKTYDKMYSYDTLGFSSGIGLTSTIYGANVFTGATPGEKLTHVAVGFYDTTNYEIYVNPDGKTTDISSMTKVASGSFDYGGYKTVKLTTPVTINSDTFTVAVKYTSPDGSTMFIATEQKDNSMYANVTANAGESFYSSNGTAWTDLTSSGVTRNCCIRAFTEEPVFSAPVNVKASAVSNTSNKITWDKVFNATGYEVHVSSSKTGQYTLLDTVSANSYTHNGLKSGTAYYYKVRAISASATSDFSAVVSATTAAAPTITELKASNTSVNMGASVNLTAVVSGYATGAEYRFNYSYNGGAEVTLKNYSADKTASMTLKNAGTYVFHVDGRFADGTTARKSVTVKATDPYAFTLDSISASSANQGDTISIKINASGNTAGVLYKFVWSHSNWKNWGVIQHFSTNTAVSLKLLHTGNYDLYVDALGKDGRLVKINKTITSLNPSSFTFNGVSVTGTPKQNETVTVKANISGNTLNMLYKFVWSCDNWKKWGVIQHFDKSNTATHKLLHSGKYDFYVDAMSVNGKIVTKSASLSVSDPYGFNVTGVVASTNGKTGSNVTVKANVSGYTSGLLYKYVWSYNNWQKWGVMSHFSNADTASVTLKYAGRYDFYADVLGKNGKVITGSTTVNTTLGWTPAMTLSADSVKKNNPVNVTANVNGGTGMMYKIVWNRGDWKNWGVVKPMDSNSSASFTPTVTGKYNIYVDFVDAYGNVKTLTKVLTVS